MKLSADKLVVITGACGAIASSFIQPLLNKGYKLLLADFNHEQINQFKSKYSSFIEANSVHLICANCCSEDGILAVLAYLDSFNMRPYAFMHLAILVPLIGVPIFFNYQSPLNWSLSTQLGAAILWSKHIIPIFLQQGSGKVIFFSSIQGVAAPKFDHYHGSSMSSPIEYTAVKHALIGLQSGLPKISQIRYSS